MNKKTIISKTLLFIFILLFITLFINIFGEENTLIGVTTITAALMFLSNDLTLNPVKNTFKLVLFNVFLGVASYIATTNMYIAIPINFGVMFIVGFTLCHNLKNPSYLPYTLQYVFMLSTPIGMDKFAMRMASLVFGAIVIMIVQFISNRGRITKLGDKILVNICLKLNDKIRLIRKDEDTEAIDGEIRGLINSFKKIVYEKRESEFYLTEEGKAKLDILLSLSRINNILNDINHSSDLEYIEEKVILLIDNIKICLEDSRNLDNLEALFEEIINEDEINSYDFLKVINIIEIIEDDLNKLRELKKKDYNLVKKVESIPSSYKRLWRYRREISRDSLRFTYGFRLALGISLSAFIVDYFHIVDGRWILFTVNSINQPQYEMVKKRSVDRIFATVVGTIIITILFTIFKDPNIRGLIIMGSGYISTYIKEYRYSIICVTVSAVGSAALVGNVGVLSQFRILYVIIGIIIAVLINKFVFPFSIKDSNNNLIKIYNDSVEKMMKNLVEVSNNSSIDEEMKNLVLYTGLVEDRLLTNNSGKYTKELESYLKEQHMLVMNIYDLYRRIQKYSMDKDNIIKSLEYIMGQNI